MLNTLHFDHHQSKWSFYIERRILMNQFCQSSLMGIKAK